MSLLLYLFISLILYSFSNCWKPYDTVIHFTCCLYFRWMHLLNPSLRTGFLGPEFACSQSLVILRQSALSWERRPPPMTSQANEVWRLVGELPGSSVLLLEALVPSGARNRHHHLCKAWSNNTGLACYDWAKPVYHEPNWYSLARGFPTRAFLSWGFLRATECWAGRKMKG